MTRIKETMSYETSQILEFSKHDFALEKDYYLRNIALIHQLNIRPIIKFDKKNQVIYKFKSDTTHLVIVSVFDKDTEGLLLITNDGALAHRLLSPKKHVDKCYFSYIYYRVKPNSSASNYRYHKHPVQVEYVKFDEIADVVNNWNKLINIENFYFNQHNGHKTVFETRDEWDNEVLYPYDV